MRLALFFFCVLFLSPVRLWPPLAVLDGDSDLASLSNSLRFTDVVVGTVRHLTLRSLRDLLGNEDGVDFILDDFRLVVGDLRGIGESGTGASAP